MTQYLLRLSFVSLLFLAMTAMMFGAPTISSTSPTTNKLNVSATSDITITFNESMDNATLTSSTIKVHGNYRGYYSGSFSYGANSVTINPDSSFKAGEVITVIVTTGVENASNVAMASPRVFNFTVDAPAGYAKFSSPTNYTAYGSGSGNHYVTLADLDKDGDIDIASTTSLYDIMSVMLNNGDGTYASAVTYSTLNAFQIRAADVDGDGDMDLVVANNNAFGISVFVNNGSGSFSTRNDYDFDFPQSNANSLVTVDMDGDGDIDIVANDLTNNYLHVMKNNGSGVFSSTGFDFLFTTKFGGLSYGDLDKDGDMDILATIATGDSVELFVNDGTGALTLQTRFYWTSTDGPTATLIADINSTTGDKQDLVWLNGNSDILTYFKDGSGIPLFTADNVSVGDYPIQVNAVDVDTDSDLDLVVANYNASTFSLLTNAGSGTGTFSTTKTYAVPSNPDDLSTADLDGDGDMDVVTINNNATVSVFKNYNGGHVASVTPANGSLDLSASSNIVIVFDENVDSGTLTSANIKIRGSASGVHAWTLSSYVAGTYTATIDPTNDFAPGEVVTVVVSTGVESSVGINLEKGYSSQFVVAAGNGAVFGAKTDYSVGTQPKNVIATDLNSDGYPDIVAVNSGSDNVSVRLNNGDGTYGSETLLSTGDNPTSVAAGDVDGDGDVDLVVTVTGANQLARFLNNDSGSFGSATTFSTANGPNSIALADIDVDGDLDAVYTVSSNVYSQKNNGTGTFSSEDNASSGTTPVGIAVADIDNDGDVDFISVNSGSSTVRIAYGNGSNWYSSGNTYSVGTSPTALVTGDFNGDGYIDVVTTNLASGNGTISYLENNQSGGLNAKVDYTVATGAEPRGITALDIDGDGDLDVVVANGAGDAAKVFINDGSGLFSDGGQFTTNDNPYGIASADVDGDGLMDIVTANYGGGNVSVLMNELSAPVVTTSAATSITTTGATLNGIVNANNLTTAAKFAYKLSSSGTYSDTIVATPTGFSGGANTSVSAALTGLLQNTMYDFKAVGINSAGTSEGSALNFTTLEDVLVVSSTTPSANALDVDTAANIAVTFNISVEEDSLNSSNVKVWGSFSGPIAGVISYDDPSKTMTFNPTGFFRAGEIVRITLTNGIASNSALSFNTPKTYSFTVAATGTGIGFFNTQTVSNHFSKSESRFVSADVDNDGDIDLLGFYYNSGFTVSFNNGGTFAAPTHNSLVTDITLMRFADMDGDGFGDIIATRANNSQYIVILKNNGSGSFALWDSINTGSTSVYYGTEINDFNNDGKNDVAYYPNYTGFIHIAYNSAGWTNNDSYAITAGNLKMTSGDINNDGDIDLLVADEGVVRVLVNNGDESFASAVTYNFAANGYVETINVQDFNGDGFLDIMTSGQYSGNYAIAINLNEGDGTFGSETTYPISIQPAVVNVGDLDGDGDQDIAIVYQNESSMNVAYNNGSGVFNQQALFNVGLPGFAIMDYDNDGDLDIIGKDYSGNVDLKILENTVPTAPSTAASNITFDNNYGSLMRVNWSNGNGTNRIVVMRQGGAVNANPSDNTTYTANATFGSGNEIGSGNYVIYNGTGSSVTVSGLSVSTTYHVTVFEYNGLSGQEKYGTTGPGTGNETTNSVDGIPFDTTAGYALNFNGRWASTANSFTLGNAFTLELWAKPTSIGEMVIMVHGNDKMWVGMDGSGKFTGMVYDEDEEENISITGTSTASANQWYHITLTGANGSPLKLYVNGVLEATSGGNISEVETSSDVFYPGGDYNSASYRGHIDEIRLWSDIRTEEEIRTNMFKTLSGIPANLVSYWQLNEGSGSTSADLAGNNQMEEYDSFLWVTSGAPVGSATITNASVAASNTGPHTVGNATLSMTDGFDNPVDILVSELTAEPSNYPTGYGSSIGGKYFVINVFGDPGTFSTSLTLNFGAGVITAGQELEPGTIQLFKRESNSSGNWTLVGGAASAVASTGEVTWAGITSFSQFLALSSDNELPPSITITKANGADWTLAKNQDRISENIWLTRANYGGLFNIKTEEEFSSSTSPEGTEWAFGTTADDIESLEFSSFRDLRDYMGGSLENLPGKDVVLHLISEDIYLDVHFNSWSSGGDGGFSYTRSLKPLEVFSDGLVSPLTITPTSAQVTGRVYSKDAQATAYVIYGTASNTYTDSVIASPGTIPLDTVHTVTATVSGLTSSTTYYYRIGVWNGTSYARSSELTLVPHEVEVWSKNNGTITFTKDDYADYTQAQNQDQLTSNIWITRQNSGWIFNIHDESEKSDTSPAGTEWAFGTTDDIANLTFNSWLTTIENQFGAASMSSVGGGEDMVLHLIEEDIYLDIKFTSWTSGSGGGFSYDRATAPLQGSFSHASDVTSTEATLNGNVYSTGSNATAKFLYGTVSGTYTDSVAVTPGTIDADSLTTVSADVTSLSPGTVYYVKLASQNDTRYKQSSEATFMTMSQFAGNALRFDGSDDYVRVGNESDFDFSSAVTLEAWIKPSTLSEEAGIVTKNSGNGAHPYQIRIEGDEVTLGFYSDEIDWNPVTTTDANLVAGEWVHIAGTYDMTTAKIYVNGVLKASESFSFSIPQNNQPLEIGRTNNNHFSGAIDEVRVWNVARTQQQIQDNMRLPFTSAQSGLVGYWQFNALSGTSAQNHGTGSSGTLMNFDFTASSGWEASGAMIGPLAGTITGISNVGATGATFAGEVYSTGSNASAKFLYGTVSGTYTDSVSATPGTIDQESITAVSATTSTLAEGTLYYVAVASTNASIYHRSNESSFMTMSSSPGNSLRFDGSNDYVRIEDENALDLTTTYTLEAWIKPEGFSSMAGIISKYQSNGADGYFIRLSNDAPYTGIRFDEHETASGILSAGNWYHIAAVNNNGTRTLYVNGSPVSISGEGYTTNSNSDPVRIGSDFGGRYFDGVIDEVRIWNVARTQQQIQDNMNTPFSSAQSGLVAYFQLNANSGTIAQNHGTTANGTLINFNFDENSGWVESAAPLPVELTSFTATSVRLNTELKWGTATEINNHGFEIERTFLHDLNSEKKSSAAAKNWSSVGFVEGSGNSNAPKEYSFKDKVQKPGKYSYRLKQIDRDGQFKYTQSVEIEVGTVPKVFALEQNYPNPFNPSTTIGFTLNATGKTSLKIYDAIGREVVTLVDEVLEAGVYHQQIFNASRFASGVYFARLVSGSNVQVKKLMLMK